MKKIVPGCTVTTISGKHRKVVSIDAGNYATLEGEVSKFYVPHLTLAKATSSCRCGWDGNGEHPCHGEGYKCKKPSSERFYVLPSDRTSLAGMQMKFSARSTFACDECWEWFKKRNNIVK